MAGSEEQKADRSAGEYQDPTALILAQIQGEIAALKNQFQEVLAAEVRVIVTRIQGIEKGIDKAADDYVRVPTLLDRAVLQIHQVMDRRFEWVTSQFDATEKLRNEKFFQVQGQLRESEKAANKQAESFATASQKSEANFVKQVDSLGTLIQTNSKAHDDKITDVKERVLRIEAAAVGRMDTKAETHTSSSYLVSLIALGLTVIGLLIAFLVNRPGGH